VRPYIRLLVVYETQNIFPVKNNHRRSSYKLQYILYYVPATQKIAAITENLNPLICFIW